MEDFLTIVLWAFVPVVVMVVYFVATRFANVIGNENGFTGEDHYKSLTLAEAIRRKGAPKQHLRDQNIKAIAQKPMTRTTQAAQMTDERRSAVLDVIVQQALAGASWREISKGPMQIYNISQQEVEAEMERRLGN